MFRKNILIAAVVLVLVPLFSLFSKTDSLIVNKWLKAGPVIEKLPIFHNEKDINSHDFKLSNLLSFDNFDISEWQPKKQDNLIWNSQIKLLWKEVETDSGIVSIVPKNENSPQICYLACYINAQTFVKGKLSVKGSHLFKVFVDGKEILTKCSSDKKASSKPANTDITLYRGLHLLIIKTLKDPQYKKDWNIKVKFLLDENTPPNSLSQSIDASQNMTVEHLLNGERPVGIKISPFGNEAIVTIKSVKGPDGDTESWLELRSIPKGNMKQALRGNLNISSVKYSPDGNYISYITRNKSKATLWLYKRGKGIVKPLLKDVENVSNYVWSPDSKRIFYSCTIKPEKKDDDLKRLTKMEQRWPWYNNRDFIYTISVDNGAKIRLTSGNLETRLNDINPDGNRILFTCTVSDYTERPYSFTEFFILNLYDMSVDSLFSDRWAGSAQFSPDGNRLLVKGSPSSFGGIGKDVPKGVIPNESDGQMFVYDLHTKKVEAITKNFNPSAERGFWNKKDNLIYLLTTDKDFVHLYSYNLKTKKFVKINTGVDVIHSIDIAKNAEYAAYIGSGVSQPPIALGINLKTQKYREVSNPAEKTFKNVKFGDSKQWIFHGKKGNTIDGRIYFPPDFDPSKKYPCIVYYYAGTVPVTRDFGGRYPKEVWAANGYIVYVPQPSGATGYGQEFSTRHVNNWGKTVAGEIIQCTEKFLDSHSFVDRKKVGCIGASYGGFMTMLLVTRTDIFSAAVAHAGISSISSYWGQGFWGYSYSATATANSFPWNRRDIYVDQSPLFYADKVKTPILLLHGTVDTNVPTGESIQFYTALKLLGRDVELILIKGQNHHIMEYSKRKKWSKTILAYFDWKLKGDKRWWANLYPDE